MYQICSRYAVRARLEVLKLDGSGGDIENVWVVYK